jgi:hypothetical protein
MYADDIVLLASSADELQQMLDVVSAYASRWQFRFNTKPGKSNVVITGPRDEAAEQRQFMLGDGVLTRSAQYKYLGVEMGNIDEKNCFGSYFDRALVKARFAANRLLYAVRGSSSLQVETAVHLFKTLVRPILEYASAICGPMATSATWARLDAVQIRFGKALLRIPQSAADEYVLRELRLERMEQRALVAAFKYFGHLCNMDKERLPSRLFRRRCNLVGQGGARASLSWCRAVKVRLRSAGMRREADSLEVGEDWNTQVKTWAKQEFLRRSERDMRTKPTLELFRALRPAKSNGILRTSLDHAGAAIRVKLRCQQAPLMVAVGASARIEHNRRTCPVCKENVVENAEHFVSRCKFYTDLRQQCLQKLGNVIGDEMASDFKSRVEDSLVDIFLGDSFASKLLEEKRSQFDVVICNFLRLAWRRRDIIWKTLTIEGNPWRLR